MQNVILANVTILSTFCSAFKKVMLCIYISNLLSGYGRLVGESPKMVHVLGTFSCICYSVCYCYLLVASNCQGPAAVTILWRCLITKETVPDAAYCTISTKCSRVWRVTLVNPEKTIPITRDKNTFVLVANVLLSHVNEVFTAACDPWWNTSVLNSGSLVTCNWTHQRNQKSLKVSWSVLGIFKEGQFQGSNLT